MHSLPKVTVFKAIESADNGTECLSRGGKMTAFDYPIFQSSDPI